MPGNRKITTAAELLAKLRPGVQDGRSAALVRMVQAIDSAKARAVIAGAKAQDYLINCRIGGQNSDLKGDADARRHAFSELIRTLEPFDEHLSTSTWLLRSVLRSQVIVELLAQPLDPKHDVVSVSHVGLDRATFGNVKLKP